MRWLLLTCCIFFSTQGLAQGLIPQGGWILLYVDSEELVGAPGDAVLAFDGDPSTLWHTQWLNGFPAHPHEIQIDLGAIYEIDGFRVLPRQDGSDNGRINQFEFYVSPDGLDWGNPVVTGTLPDSTSEQEITFAPVQGGYVRLVSLNAHDSDPWATIGEFNLLGTLSSGNPPPNGFIDSPAGDVVISVGESVTFSGTGTDPENDPSLTYQWNFGAGSGVPNSTQEDPGPQQFNNIGTYTVTFTVTDSLGLSDPTPGTRLVTVQGIASAQIPQVGWSLKFVDSEELIGAPGGAVLAFDGNPATLWHTQWFNGFTAHPHEIQINLGAFYEIDGFRVLPRQDGSDNGRINQFEFYVSPDGLDWGDPVVTGTLPDNESEQEITFAPVPGGYVRLVSLNAHDSDPWATIGELNVLGIPSLGNQAPNGIIDSPAADVAIIVGGSITFAGTGTDPENDPSLTYQWDFGTGSGVPGSTQEDPGPQQFNNIGTYTVTLTVTDSSGVSDPTPATRTVDVIPVVNLPPNGVIDSPADNVAIIVGESITFAGTGTDPENDPSLTYQWDFGAGSGVPGSTQKDPGPQQFNNIGTYTVTFTVTDSSGISDPTPATRTVDVIPVGNLPPDGVIDAPVGNVAITVGDSITFAGTGTDPENDPSLTYQWNFGAGSGVPGSTLEDPGPQQFNNIGTYTVTFTVTDSSGVSDPTPATRTVDVIPVGNLPPDGVIDAPVDNVSITVGDSITFAGTGTDPENDPSLTYQWDFGAGSGVPGSTQEDPGPQQFNNIGTYTITFTVTDSSGVPDPTPATRFVSVQDNSSSLILQAGWTLLYVDSEELVGAPGDAVLAFDGDPSTLWHTQWLNGFPAHPHEIQIDLGAIYEIDGFRVLPRQDGSDNGRINQFEFYVSPDGLDWGNPVVTGTLPDSTSEQEITFAPVQGGYVRLVSLNAHDSDPWATIGEFNLLGTLSSGNPPPNGFIDSPAGDVVISVGESVTFSGTGTDPENDPSLTYQWNFGAGSGVPNSTQEDPGPQQFNNIGTYTVTFTVTDSSGLSDPTPGTRLVTVQGIASAAIPQGDWGLLYVDSEELVGAPGGAVLAFDGNPATLWHTQWFNGFTAHPHEIQINLGAFYEIDGFRVLPRQDGSDNGRINQFEFYVSPDGLDWGDPVVTGTLPDNKSEQEITFAPVPGGYVRLVSLNAHDSDPWATIGELNVLGILSLGNQAPNGIIDSPAADVATIVGGSITFAGTGTDPENDPSLTYQWDFGTGSGVPGSTQEDPGPQQFNNIGTYTVTLTVTDSSGRSDPTPATRTVDVCAAPSVRLTAPLDLHLQSSADLYVNALPCLDSNLHSGWGVRFSIRETNGPIIAQFDDDTAPFEARFEGLDKSEYEVRATIVDELNDPVPNAEDTASPVGIGDYYVAMGDSITLGFGDDIASDNMSMDGRNNLGGFEPILNNHLTNERGYPHTVINEGGGGNTSVDGLSLLTSVLADHPESQFILIQYGTNDAGIPIPDGFGETSGPNYDGTFKANLQQMITRIFQAGKVPYLAKVPFSKGEYSGRNALIQKYNQVVDELIFENGLPVAAPNFYDFFENNQDQYSDDQHLNGVGYQSMADLWKIVLTQ